MKKNQILKKMRDDLEEIRNILDEMTEDAGCGCGCGCTAGSDLDNDSEELVDIDEEIEDFIEKIFNRNTYAIHCNTAKKRMKKVIKAAYKTNGADKYALFYRLAERIGTFVAAMVRDKTETEVKIFCSGACRSSLTLIHAWQLKTAITAALMNYSVALQLNLSEIQLRNLNKENIKEVPEIRQMMTGFESVYRIFKNMISVIKVSEGGIEQVLQDRVINTFTDTFIHVIFDILDIMLVAAHREQKHFGIRYSFCMSQLKEVNETVKEHLHYIFDAVDFNSDDISSLFKEPPIEEDDEVSDDSEDGAEEYLDTDEEDDDDDSEFAVEEEDEEDDAEDGDNDDSSDDDSENSNSEDSDGDIDIDEEKI